MRRVSKLKYASFTLTLRRPYAAEIAALRCGPECTKIAHRHSLTMFHRRLGYHMEFRSGSQLLARPLDRNVSGIFVEILEDSAGDFPRGLFWALFPTKMRKNPVTTSAIKSGGPKIKIREKIRSARNRP